MHRQALCCSLRLCGNIFSEDICTVDICVVSLYSVELLVTFVCFVSRKLFLLLIYSVDLWSYGGAFGHLFVCDYFLNAACATL